MTKQRKNFSGHCRLCGKWKVNGNKGDWHKRSIIARQDLRDLKDRKKLHELRESVSD